MGTEGKGKRRSGKNKNPTCTSRVFIFTRTACATFDTI